MTPATESYIKLLEEENLRLHIEISQLHSDLSVAQQKLGETPGYNDWKCSFCGESEGTLLEGTGAFICSACVEKYYIMFVKPMGKLRDKALVEDNPT